MHCCRKDHDLDLLHSPLLLVPDEDLLLGPVRPVRLPVVLMPALPLAQSVHQLGPVVRAPGIGPGPVVTQTPLCKQRQPTRAQAGLAFGLAVGVLRRRPGKSGGL